MEPEPSIFDSLVIPDDFVPSIKQLQPGQKAKQAATTAETATVQPPPGDSFKFTTDKASEVCERFALGEQATYLLTSELTVLQYLAILNDKQLYPDAVRVLAHGLPKRGAVWWACLCLREALGAHPAPKFKSALEAAETWAKNPSEENRRQGLPAAETAGFGTPVGMAALAVFWSGGSVAPPDGPIVPPADHMTAEAVAGAVLLTAVGAAPEEIAKRHQRFIALGMAVASGTTPSGGNGR